MGRGFRETGSVDGRTPLRRLESTMVPTGEARRCSAAFAPDLVALYARPVCAPSALCRAGALMAALSEVMPFLAHTCCDSA